MYYILTSKRRKNILATKDLYKCYDFFTKHKDAQIYRLDYNYKGKGKLLKKLEFLKTFFKITEDKEKFFTLAEYIIKGKNNLNYFLGEMLYLSEYKKWKQTTQNHL